VGGGGEGKARKEREDAAEKGGSLELRKKLRL
jgi:hypothetical protein